MEWFNNLVNKLAEILKTKIDFLGVGEYSPAFYIAVGGIALVFLAFVVALIAKANTRSVKFRKYLDDTTEYINTLGAIDESNVGYFNERLPKMPAAVTKGWGNFLEHQTGYPSDYISETEVLGDRKTNIRRASGRGFFKLFSAIVVLVGMALAAISCKDMFSANAQNITLIVLAVAGAVCGPLLVFVIFLAILNGGYSRQLKKQSAAFRRFLDALDERVLLYREEEDEFVSENIEEINATIEEILANKLEDKEIIEIVTTPKADAALVIEAEPEPVKPEPVKPEPAKAEPAKPAPVQETVAAALPKEEEVKYQKLIQLVYIVDSAIKDKDITREQLEELAAYIEESKNSGLYNDPEDQDILVRCLELLANAYYYGK